MNWAGSRWREKGDLGLSYVRRYRQLLRAVPSACALFDQFQAYGSPSNVYCTRSVIRPASEPPSSAGYQHCRVTRGGTAIGNLSTARCSVGKSCNYYLRKQGQAASLTLKPAIEYRSIRQAIYFLYVLAMGCLWNSC